MIVRCLVMAVVIILGWMAIVDAAVFEVEKRQREVNKRYATGTILH